MEQYLASALRNRGQWAECACELYGPKEFDQLNEQQAIEKLKSKGYYVPGHMNYTPYGFYYNRFWGYSRAIYGRIYSPGYYVTDTKYFWESNLYDLTSGDLLYSSQSQSFDPSTSAAMGKEYGKLIVEDLDAKRVIAFAAVPTKSP